ncbi:hypothetical protein ACFE04_004269 [Oxalis oulophora]
MSLIADSPVHSSSSDDFAALLDAEIKRRKVEIVEEVDLASTSQGTLQQDGVSMKQELCTHPGTFQNMCIICGKKMEDESGVTMAYIHKGLRFANNEINRLRNTDMKVLLDQRKLILVLDLDHTLLNSAILSHIIPEEEYLKNQVDSLQDVARESLFMLDYMRMMTKLRPFVHQFLREASELFQMYIYTMGDRAYAAEMAKLLDPKREYFSGRVISRDDGTLRNEKGLDIVLGHESGVIILDDTESATDTSEAPTPSQQPNTRDPKFPTIVHLAARQDVQTHSTRSHVCSSATNVVLHACVCLLGFTDTKKFALAKTTGRPREEDLNALRFSSYI